MVRVLENVWGSERNALLRRSKVVLNISLTPGDFVGVRLVLALAAGAVVVTEPLRDPFPFVPGEHFVEAPLGGLLETARDLVADEPRRRRIAESGQALLTGELTMARCLGRVLARLSAAEGFREARSRDFRSAPGHGWPTPSDDPEDDQFSRAASIGAMPDRRVILVGAASFAGEVGDLAAAAGFEVAAWIEGLDRTLAEPGHLPPILWVDDQASFEPALPVLPAIGSVQRMGIVRRLVGEGRRLATLIHPSAVVSPTAVVEPGCVICPLVVVGAYSHVGEGTVLNRGSLVGHHTEIGRYSFLGPGANVAGKVTLGEQVYVGAGGIVRDHLQVGDRAVVGMGAVAVKDVPADTHRRRRAGAALGAFVGNLRSREERRRQRSRGRPP